MQSNEGSIYGTTDIEFERVNKLSIKRGCPRGANRASLLASSGGSTHSQGANYRVCHGEYGGGGGAYRGIRPFGSKK